MKVELSIGRVWFPLWTYSQGIRPDLSFWKDKAGWEVYFLVEEGKTTWAMEVKSRETAQDDMFTGLRYWDAHHPKDKGVGALVYGGGETYTHRGYRVIPWNAL